MANLIRTAKPGSDWTPNESTAYNIVVVPQSKEEFFATHDFLTPTEPSLAGFMTTESREDATDEKTKELLHYLDLAMNPKVGHESAVCNFAAELLKALRYNEKDRIVFTRRIIPLLICGELRLIFASWMTTRSSYLWRRISHCFPEPQVIAEAIAAFPANNKGREAELHLRARQTVTFPCFTLVGTSPTFYKVTVTAELSKAVQTGTYPTTETQVLRYIPLLPRRNSERMRPLVNRLEILRCLEALKQLIRR